MLLYNQGLGSILTSLSLASSLFKPSPTADDRNEVIDSSLGETGETMDVFGIPLPEVQPFSPFSTLHVVEQDKIEILSASDLSPTISVDLSSSSGTSVSPSVTTASAPLKTMGDIAQDASCVVEPYTSPNVLLQPFPPFDASRANVYRYRQQQGVNLGSWFVHEQWMTPSLFTCASGKRASELDIASGWGSTTSARALLEHHWDRFITADDFAHLASIGINTVRLPIGYWNLGPLYCKNTPFEPVSAVYQNAWSHVVRVINMAATAGLGILVDLHGAVGSQNGQTHSGISDGQTNLFTNPAYQAQTISVLTFLTQQLAAVTNVVGIQILNEPQNVPQLTDFYTHALTTLRQVSSEAAKMPFYVHDGFDLQRFNKFISTRTDFVVQDHHSYFVFTPEDDTESADNHTKDVNGSIAQSFAAAAKSQRDNLVIDEWSCALTPESLSKAQDPSAARKRFCEVQMHVYQNATAGWNFWSYDKEGCDNDEGWCFKRAIGQSLPATFFSYSRGKASGPAVVSALTKMQPPDILEILNRAAQADSFDPTDFASATSLSSGSGKDNYGFAAVRARRHSPARQATLFGPTSLPALSLSQRAVIRGYLDGFLTAKIFAMNDLSKLGFAGQYIEDSLQSHGPSVIQPGMEVYYREWFHAGLQDGEDLVRGIVLAAT